MLAHANTLVTVIYKVARDGQNAPILDAYGRPTLVLDGNGATISELSANVSEQDLVGYIGLLDSVKQIENQLGYGPL